MAEERRFTLVCDRCEYREYRTDGAQPKGWGYLSLVTGDADAPEGYSAYHLCPRCSIEGVRALSLKRAQPVGGS